MHFFNYKINSESKPFYSIFTVVEDFFKENKVNNLFLVYKGMKFFHIYFVF